MIWDELRALLLTKLFGEGYLLLFLSIKVRILMLLELCFMIWSQFVYICVHGSKKCPPVFHSRYIQNTSSGRKIICHWCRWELTWQTVHSVLNIHNMHSTVSLWDWNNSFRVLAISYIRDLLEQSYHNSKTAMADGGGIKDSRKRGISYR